eukprot:11169798-Lingulodinium_polyedra.AAC.1
MRPVELTTVNGGELEIYGGISVGYYSGHNQWALTQYYVTGARAPVIGVSGLNRVGYDLHARGAKNELSFST